jgi:hypothetical protein
LFVYYYCFLSISYQLLCLIYDNIQCRCEWVTLTNTAIPGLIEVIGLVCLSICYNRFFIPTLALSHFGRDFGLLKFWHIILSQLYMNHAVNPVDCHKSLFKWVFYFLLLISSSIYRIKPLCVIFLKCITNKLNRNRRMKCWEIIKKKHDLSKYFLFLFMLSLQVMSKSVNQFLNCLQG